MIETHRKDSESLIENLKAIIEERETTIKELRKEAVDFQRIVLQNKDQSRVGKVDAHRLLKFREQKLLEKQEALEKMENKRLTLEEKIVKGEK